DQPLDPPPVDEQGRRGEDAERDSLVHVRLDVGTEPSLLHAPGEGRAVEAEGARVGEEIFVSEGRLPGEETVVVLPVPPLGPRAHRPGADEPEPREDAYPTVVHSPRPAGPARHGRHAARIRSRGGTMQELMDLVFGTYPSWSRLVVRLILGVIFFAHGAQK